MYHHYACIRRRIAEPPKWFDENAVPRYDDFSPEQTACIYAKEAVLLRVECQNCGRPFDVCMSWREHEHLFGGAKQSLAERVADGSIHYGDPPNVECCPAGPTMNSVPRQVLQFWRVSDSFDWARAPEHEIVIACDWADEPMTFDAPEPR